MDTNFIRERLTELRIEQNISEYKMSLDLGHSKSYIQSISSGKALPSLTEFLYICDYLNISPKDFFDTELTNPLLVSQALEGLKQLAPDDLQTIINLIERFNKK